jgi:hypothetical protein
MLLLYDSDRCGCNPRGPGGTQIGIVYVAAPEDDTVKDPGVRPTAAKAFDAVRAASVAIEIDAIRRFIPAS